MATSLSDSEKMLVVEDYKILRCAQELTSLSNSEKMLVVEDDSIINN